MSSQYNDEDEGGGGHGATLDLSRDGSLGGSGTNGLLREIPSPPRITRDSSAYPPSLTVYHETASQTYVDEDRHVHFMALKEPEIPVTWRLKERMKVGSSKQAVAHCRSLTAGWPLAAAADRECGAGLVPQHRHRPTRRGQDVAVCAQGVLVRPSHHLQAEGHRDDRQQPAAAVRALAGRCVEAAAARSSLARLRGLTVVSIYVYWLQARAKYKQALDPTMEDVKKLCASLRRNAKSDRLLFHYNGHGVPRPTSSGEIWVFNKTYTQYIPLSIYDLRTWVGNPSIYVLDCSGAGVLLPHFLQVGPDS